VFPYIPVQCSNGRASRAAAAFDAVHRMTKKTITTERRTGRDRRKQDGAPPKGIERRRGIEPRKPEVSEVQISESDWGRLEAAVNLPVKTPAAVPSPVAPDGAPVPPTPAVKAPPVKVHKGS
jgi:hypothetical protein